MSHHELGIVNRLAAPPLPTLEFGKALQKLREKFDALLIQEVRVFGGIPVHGGRTGKEETELREAIAEVLEFQYGALRVREEEGHGEQQTDQGAALLPVDPSAAVKTEALPHDTRWAQAQRDGRLAALKDMWHWLDKQDAHYDSGAEAAYDAVEAYVNDAMDALDPQALNEISSGSECCCGHHYGYCLQCPIHGHPAPIGSGNQVSQEQAASTNRSAAPKTALSSSQDHRGRIVTQE